MPSSRILRRLIYGGGGSLRDYEAACLAAIAQSLPPDAGPILELQVRAVEVIQRFSDDKLTVLHTRELEDRELFPNRRPELRAATFAIGATEPDPRRIGGTLVLHHGRISSLEFDPTPKSLPRGAVGVLEVKVRDDLLERPSAGSPTAGAEQPEILPALPGRLGAADVEEPASAADRAAFLESLATATPDDYRQLLAATDGFVTGRWRFLGTSARTLAQPETTYVVAAEREDSTAALCFRSGQRTPAVVLYDEIDEEEVAEHTEFLPALEAAAGGEA